MFSPSLILKISILFICAAPMAVPAPQEEEAVKKTEIQDDLEFAVSLARFRYFDLANEFIDKIKGTHLSDEEKNTLSLRSAEILKLASENAIDDDERMEFYKQAVAGFKSFVDYNNLHPEYQKARLDLAETYANQGKFLRERMGFTEDQVKIEEWKTEANKAFQEGVQLYNEGARDLRTKAELLEETGDFDKAKQYIDLARQSDYKKGIAYYNWALIFDKEEFNREDYLTRAINTLDDYIWDAPEDDFYALWAFIYQAMSYMELDNLSDALDLARQVYNPETGIDLEQAVDLAPEYARLITDLVETAYLVVARINYRMGEYEKVEQTVKELIDKFKAKKFDLSPLGGLARLELAKAFLETNDAEKIDEAAGICKDVADNNPTNIVGRDAKVMLKGILEKETTTAISPDVLISAAEGSRSENKYIEAIMGYMKVLQAAQTVQLKEEFNARSWYAIGQCYLNLNRYLEASVAFERGFMDPHRGKDENYYTQNATKWYQALTRRYKETQDSFDNKIMRDARDSLVKLNISTDLVFLIAQEKFGKATVPGLDKKEKESLMKEALDDFAEVDKQSALYERARVFLGRCQFELDKYQEALTHFDEFKKYADGTALPGTAKQKMNRTIALAEESFWRAETLLKLEKYSEALKTLEGFEGEFNTQTNFFPAVIYNRIMAKLGMEEFLIAEKYYDDLKEKYPDSVRTSSAAYYIASAAIAKARSIRESLAKDAAPTKLYIDLLKKGTEYMHGYCELSGYDSFTNLRNVCEWYKELGELGEEGALETSRDTYQKLIKEFGKVPEYQEEIQDAVYRGYGEVLNKLQDFQAGKPIWLRLLSANPKNVTILRATAACLGGWMEKTDDSYVEIPGFGDYAPDPTEKTTGKINLTTAQGIWSYLLKGIEDAGSKYSPEWWEAKFYSIYMRYRAGEEYPVLYDHALKLIKNQRLFQPDMGGPEMRARFKYLEDAASRAKRNKK